MPRRRASAPVPARRQCHGDGGNPVTRAGPRPTYYVGYASAGDRIRMSSLPVKFFGAGPAGKPQWPTVADSAPADSDGAGMIGPARTVGLCL